MGGMGREPHGISSEGTNDGSNAERASLAELRIAGGISVRKPPRGRVRTSRGLCARITTAFAAHFSVLVTVSCEQAHRSPP